MSSVNLVGDLNVSERLNREMLKVSEDLCKRCILVLAEKYNFNGEEAVDMLGLSNVKVVIKSVSKSNKKFLKEKVVKSAFLLPWSNEFKEEKCYALRQNKGLYTQCTNERQGDFCKGCASQMEKTGSEVPEYGTIQQRMSVGIMEYVDPKGRKPISYTKIMKKKNLTKEMVVEEAGKLNIKIDPIHFEMPSETDGKRGRPASKISEPKVKGVKGRPKKSKRVVEIDGDDDDLFSTLVKNANMEESIVIPEEIPQEKKKGKSSEEKEAERLAKEEKRLKDKAEKEAKLAADKAEKEAKLATDKAEKEAKLAADKAEKEAKLAANKAEKEAKLAATKAEKEAEKAAKLAANKAEKEAEKAAKLAADKAEKEAKKEAEKEAKKEAKKLKTTSKPGKKTVAQEEDDEPDVVKKIEFEGKKYLKSKKTGIVYDYEEYVKNGDQVVVGKWNDNSNKIEFETCEEDYEE
jgi:chemotaxis protein histidine kinase CheA